VTYYKYDSWVGDITQIPELEVLNRLAKDGYRVIPTNQRVPGGMIYLLEKEISDMWQLQKWRNEDHQELVKEQMSLKSASEHHIFTL
jgi:hypothetical protein